MFTRKNRAVFVNHQFARLVLDSPAASVLPVYALLFLAAALTTKRTPGQGFLDHGQTDQLKGLAVLLIVAGHINLILAGDVRVPNFAGFGVAAFLFCSGYGLASSASDKACPFPVFFARRASRVYLPYWLVTALILAADHIVLSMSYPADGVFMTLLGLNITGLTARFDLSRWFVTYIILVYVLFFVSLAAAKGWKARVAVMSVLALAVDAALVFLHASYPREVAAGLVRHYVMYSLLFPAGCLVAVCRESMRSSVERVINGPALRLGAVLAVVVFFVLKTIYIDPMRGQFNRADIGSILFESLLWQPAFAAFLALSLFALAALRLGGLRSGFLAAVGGISYEVYLVHFVFMQRYDPLLYRKPFALYYIVYLCIVFMMAYAVKRAVSAGRHKVMPSAATLS